MKKYILILFTLLICESLVYSQILKKPDLSNEPLHEKRDLPLDVQQKVSATSFIESFESASFPPSGWNLDNWDGGNGWTRETVGSQLPSWSSGTITAPPGGGNAVAYCTYNSSTTYNDQSLFTPTIENIQSSDTLFFWTRNQLGIADTIFIYFSNDSIDIFLGGVYYPISGANTNWQKWYIPLGERVPVGSSGYIEFNEYIEDNVIYGGAICLDLVQLNSTATGSPPTTTTGSATSITTTSATLNGMVNPNGLPTGYVFSYGTTTNYDKFKFGIIELTGSNSQPVSVTISDLTPNTEYHFELSATNDAGDSFGGDITFTTASEGGQAPSATTNGATGVTTTTATLNGTINPNGLNTTYYFEYGTSTSYGNTKSGTSGYTGSANVNVSENITGLIPNTPYHYRIVATNSGGTTNGSDITFTTSSSGTSDINLVLTKISLSTFSWQIGSPIQVDLTEQNIGSSSANQHVTQLYLSLDNKTDINDIPIGDPISFPSLAPGDTILMSEIFLVPDIQTSAYFVLASVDVNNSVEETDEKNGYYNTYQIILGYPSSIPFNNTFTFNDPGQSSSFRMIGVPGNDNISISAIFFGSSGEDWIAYHDNGTTTDYLVEYDATGTFNFAPGKGFWVLSKTPVEINRSSSTVPLEYKTVQVNSNQDNRIVTPINLHNEWNIITNPYEIGISWAEVQTINDVSVSIHAFNGNYSTSSTLQPYEGYYFNNVTNLSELHIPYSVNQGLPNSNLLAKKTSENILISLNCKGEISSRIQIGFNDNSKNGYDSLDMFIPPGDFEEKRISIFNPILETEYKYLSNDFRNPNKNHIYDIEIKYPIGESYDLIIEGIENIGLSNAYLVGPNVNFVNLESKSSLQLISSQKINRYTLLIGSDDFIENQQNQLLPKEYNLSQNYPNPFNPDTRIIYDIPEESFVSLKVYDILGKEIATLVSNQKQPGKYEINFSGLNLSSGIYFYTLSSSNFVETKKMILLQ